MNPVIQYYDSPLGLLKISAEDDFICEVLFTKDHAEPGQESRVTKECKRQLSEYFSASRKEFTLPLKPAGTEFQLQVWDQLQKIPFGKTISYLKLAKRLGDEKKIRAAGTANGRNPIAIIIPCHRVIGSDGSLVGYGGGLWRKKWLLEFESGNKQAQLTF